VGIADPSGIRTSTSALAPGGKRVWTAESARSVEIRTWGQVGSRTGTDGHEVCLIHAQLDLGMVPVIGIRWTRRSIRQRAGKRGEHILIIQSLMERCSPPTVTHPDVAPYCVTMPEGVQLIL
jgi:hypothetical protein